VSGWTIGGKTGEHLFSGIHTLPRRDEGDHLGGGRKEHSTAGPSASLKTQDADAGLRKEKKKRANSLSAGRSDAEKKKKSITARKGGVFAPNWKGAKGARINIKLCIPLLFVTEKGE